MPVEVVAEGGIERVGATRGARERTASVSRGAATQDALLSDEAGDAGRGHEPEAEVARSRFESKRDIFSTQERALVCEISVKSKYDVITFWASHFFQRDL